MGTLFKIRYGIRAAWSYGASALLAPQNCLSCGDFCTYLPLCARCRSELESGIVLKERRCAFCGRILISEKESCLECRETKLFTFCDGAFPLYPYVLWKKELLFKWKMAGSRSLSPFFARVLFRVLQRYYEGFTVVPVPPRPGKIKKTGWDQIADLCRYLRGLYGIRVCRALVRLGTQQQKKLSRSERLSRLGKQYALKSAFKKAACAQKLPHQVVLLDDIMTTGVTLETCAALLKEAGVQKVYALTLFAC